LQELLGRAGGRFHFQPVGIINRGIKAVAQSEREREITSYPSGLLGIRLVLAIGIVVDDAIVVVEAMQRHIDDGLSALSELLTRPAQFLNFASSALVQYSREARCAPKCVFQRPKNAK
jgi:hypothetical protein